MYKKILLLTILASLSTNVWANPAETQKHKLDLSLKVMEAVKQCKCLTKAVDHQDKLFQIPSKSQDKTRINTLKDYGEIILAMKITNDKTQADLGKIIENWEVNKPEDLKALDLKISSELRAFSSFCIAPFNSVADEIYKHSSIFSRKKIDPAQCGIVQNKK